MSFYCYINQLNDFSKSEIKLYIGVLGKRDNEDKILICFHERDFIAYVSTEEDSNFHYGKVTNEEGRSQVRNPILGPDKLLKTVKTQQLQFGIESLWTWVPNYSWQI